MKFLIASDIHGSSYYTDKILEVAKNENADKIILLGDIFNHGPRNPLPKDYAPLKVAESLNAVKDDLIVIQGNCDSQVDTMISDFDFVPHALVVSGDKTVFCTHGHVYNKDSMPKTTFNAVIYGHFHVCFIEKLDSGIIVANPGSVSLPKNDTKPSYLILEEGTLTLKTLEGETVKSVNL